MPLLMHIADMSVSFFSGAGAEAEAETKQGTGILCNLWLIPPQSRRCSTSRMPGCTLQRACAPVSLAHNYVLLRFLCSVAVRHGGKGVALSALHTANKMR